MSYESEQTLLWPDFEVISHHYHAEIRKAFENFRIASFCTKIEPKTTVKCMGTANTSATFNKLNSLNCVHFLAA
jgi:hypothetical protein